MNAFTPPLGQTPFVAYYLRKYIRANDRVLDLGCGPDRYRAVVAPVQYVGLDITAKDYRPDMPRQVEVVASAAQIPIKESVVDAVISMSAFFLFPQIDEVLHEAFRVLKPNGRILLFDYNRRTQRRLGNLDKRDYPAWTQWQFRDRLRAARFVDAEVLVPRVTRTVGAIEGAVRIAAEELLGTWAVVSGRKP